MSRLMRTKQPKKYANPKRQNAEHGSKLLGDCGSEEISQAVEFRADQHFVQLQARSGAAIYKIGSG